MKLNEKTIKEIQKRQQEIYEENIANYPDEYEIYQETLEHLIFEINQIEDWWLYSWKAIIEWLEEKKDSLHWFDMILDSVWK